MKFWGKQLIKKDGKFFIDENETGQAVYSERGLPREKKSYLDLAKDLAQSTTLIIIAPYHHFFKDILNKENILWLSPTTAQGIDKVIYSEEIWRYYLNQVEASQKIQWYIHPRLPDQRLIADKFNSDLKKAAGRLKTIQHFARQWDYNFRVNLPYWQETQSILHLKSMKAPDLLLGAGPELNTAIECGLLMNKVVWSVDTALPNLLAAHVIPDLIFSIDAGRGSWEHFISARKFTKDIYELPLVLDPCSYPAFFREPFKMKYTYQSSYPDCQKTQQHEPLTNSGGNVFSAMRATADLLFPGQKLKAIANNQRATSHISHCRGTAYTDRANWLCHKLYNTEQYAMKLSRSYQSSASIEAI